jgi:hypothetical protein
MAFGHIKIGAPTGEAVVGAQDPEMSPGTSLVKTKASYIRNTSSRLLHHQVSLGSSFKELADHGFGSVHCECEDHRASIGVDIPIWIVSTL